MHTTPTLHDWSVQAVNSNCITITINEDLSIEGTKLRILGENRNFLFDVVPTNREIMLCTPTGISVHYVKGSGNEYYKN
jgi:hypothetical protein